MRNGQRSRRLAHGLLVSLCWTLLASCDGQSAPAAQETAGLSSTAQGAPAVEPAATIDPALAGPQSTGQVLLTIFSGRRDPSWPLAPDELATLLTTLASLPAAEQGHPMPERLGYRGFSVQFVEKTGLVWSLQAYDGLVRRDKGDSVEFLTDPERRVERLLLQSGADEVDPALLQTVEEALKQIPQP